MEKIFKNAWTNFYIGLIMFVRFLCSKYKDMAQLLVPLLQAIILFGGVATVNPSYLRWPPHTHVKYQWSLSNFCALSPVCVRFELTTLSCTIFCLSRCMDKYHVQNLCMCIDVYLHTNTFRMLRAGWILSVKKSGWFYGRSIYLVSKPDYCL